MRLDSAHGSARSFATSPCSASSRLNAWLSVRSPSGTSNGTRAFSAPIESHARRHGLSSHRTGPSLPIHKGTMTMRPERCSDQAMPAEVNSSRTLSGRKRTVSLPK